MARDIPHDEGLGIDWDPTGEHEWFRLAGEVFDLLNLSLKDADTIARTITEPQYFPAIKAQHVLQRVSGLNEEQAERLAEMLHTMAPEYDRVRREQRDLARQRIEEDNKTLREREKARDAKTEADRLAREARILNRTPPPIPPAAPALNEVSEAELKAELRRRAKKSKTDERPQ